MSDQSKKLGLYEIIYNLVKQVPEGKVVTYGQIANAVGGCSARMVGYAMAALKDGRDPQVPWQRVVNAKGRISMFGIGSAIQQSLLIEEGVVFNQNGEIDLDLFRWNGF